MNIIDSCRLDGRVAVVTGAGKGIGEGIAIGLAEAGANLALVARTRADLERVAEAIRAVGRRALVVPCDVADVGTIPAAVGEVVGAYGQIDVLVNCAGIWVEGATAQMTEAEFDRTMGVNLKGTFFMCRYAIPHLERTEGCIVTLSSDVGLVGSDGASIYSALGSICFKYRLEEPLCNYAFARPSQGFE